MQGCAEGVETVKIPKTGVSNVAIRSDDRVAVSSGWDGKLRVFDYKRRVPLAVLPAHSGAAYGLAFSRALQSDVLGCEGVFASGGKDGHVVVYSLYPPPATASRDAAASLCVDCKE